MFLSPPNESKIIINASYLENPNTCWRGRNLRKTSGQIVLHHLTSDPDAIEHAGYWLAVDAIKACLDKQNHPAKGIVIARALTENGWSFKRSARLLIFRTQFVIT